MTEGFVLRMIGYTLRYIGKQRTAKKNPVIKETPVKPQKDKPFDYSMLKVNDLSEEEQREANKRAMQMTMEMFNRR